MPKLDGPLYGDWASGEIAGLLAFKKNATWGRLERKRRASRSDTENQEVQRAAFLSAKNAWHGLTDEERAAWFSWAGDPWNGYNYFLFVRLRGDRFWLGELVFGEDLFKQANKDGATVSADYENNFSTAADVLPTVADGSDNFPAWLFNKIVLSLLAIEGYLIANKANIEGS